jgi:hypothetical protein
MVTAGVEPSIGAENTQLTDPVNVQITQNATFAQSAYKRMPGTVWREAC